MHTDATLTVLLQTKEKNKILTYFHLYIVEMHSICGNNKFFMFKVCNANIDMYYNSQDNSHTVTESLHLFADDPVFDEHNITDNKPISIINIIENA